ncbi:hypothetical protein [Streptomyces sp. TLI_105]|uniref:hypothetical protein n=1 Tax=Streptomyces sp. TLI_105 TaxID=1881019 RepID=UPI000895C6C3|nr:hypothetical protein [Streptomyces sp. TLI_105]SEE61296.1 hypothetical protein SAMN05428939_8142 [Streptomyces sp. TLI_105]
MTRTIPLLHPLDDHGRLPRRPLDETSRLPQDVREAADALAAAAAKPQLSPAADIARHCHPHYLRAEPTAFGTVTFYFRAFTGRESRPEMPREAWDDPALTWKQKCELDSQYTVAQSLWSQGRLRIQAAPVLRRAAPLWQAWTTAQSELREAFEVFRHTSDGMWRAQLLRLTDAERAALDAARAWDAVAEELSLLAAEQRRDAGEEHELELETVARELGLDASDWVIRWPDDYTPRAYSWPHQTPLVRALTAEIEQQRERLMEVARLVGDHEPTPA